MINIGINGFGRIGKCILLQLLENKNFNICCLNSPNLNISEIEDYLTYDSIHHHNIKFKTSISNDTIQINDHNIKYFSDYNVKNIDWSQYGCEYVIDATGSYLTTKKCQDHNAKYVIMSSPSKDDTPTFIYGANSELYNGEKIISGSSCTTNCLAPVLKLLNDEYEIENCVFTTIHASTSSQYVHDIVNKKSRINRSLLNNIIPHTTGASSSVTCVLPFIKDKINGTSVRVPVSDVSLLDLNITLKNKNITLEDIKNIFCSHPLYKIVYDVCTKSLVSLDFITTTTPSILDLHASIDMGNGNFKLMLWYDNEWSYSSQLIRLVEHMFDYNNTIKNKYYFENIEMTDKRVVCRLDLNVPTINGEITDDFRITSAIPTIKSILSKNPEYLILTSHFGRPKGKDEKNSLQFLVSVLEKYLDQKVQFLPDGIHLKTLYTLQQNPKGIYLLENVRFHNTETDYEKFDTINNTMNIYNCLGDVFICDAFGCLHRKHMSIYGIKYFDKPYGYGHLIKQEIDSIDLLLNSNKKILSIIGGNKINDKLPIINSLRKFKNSKVFVAGGLARQYNEVNDNVIVMKDGYGNVHLTEEPVYIDDVKNSHYFAYDIGPNSLNELFDLIKDVDIIFWNGSLGVIENEIYRSGSMQLIHYLETLDEKTIIIGGGETASLFKNKNSHIYVSTGGGALLEYLQNKILYGKNLIGLEIYI
jgi:glyceraldehyde 3-phosphate dehydrogenase